MSDEPGAKRAKADLAHAAARGSLSMVPLVGGALSEAYNLLFAAPSERRQAAAVEEMLDAIVALQQAVEGISLEKLSENQSFISTLHRATRAMAATHQEVKREALRNAVLTVARGVAPDEDQVSIFIDAIEALTPSHLRLLSFLDDPEAWFQSGGLARPNITMGGLSTILEAAIPELSGRRAFYDQLGKDLHGRGYTNTEGFHTTMTVNGLFARRTSEVGRQFLSFISGPPRT